MRDGHEIEDFLLGVVRKATSVNGQVVGDDMNPAGINLGKDEREARIKGMADRYSQGERVEIDEESKALGITKKDVIKELSLREMRKIFGKS